MKQTLKAQLKDLPLISDYLHDANIFIDTIKHDSETKNFSMEIKRISYEHAKSGMKFWIIPIIEYAGVIALMTISEITKMDTHWFDDTFIDDVGYPHQILEISQEKDNEILIISDYFKIVLLSTDSTEITLEDISEPKEGAGAIDIGVGVFHGDKEIEKLKI